MDTTAAYHDRLINELLIMQRHKVHYSGVKKLSTPSLYESSPNPIILPLHTGPIIDSCLKFSLVRIFEMFKDILNIYRLVIK